MAGWPRVKPCDFGVVVGLFGVHVHQYAVGGGSLAGGGIAVVHVGGLAEIEVRVLPGVQPNLGISFRVDLLDGSELAVSNPPRPGKARRIARSRRWNSPGPPPGKH